MQIGSSSSQVTLQQLFSYYNPRELLSTPDIRADLFKRRLEQVKVTDFFGSLLDVKLMNNSYPIERSSSPDDVLQDVRRSEPVCASKTEHELERQRNAFDIQRFEFQVGLGVLAAAIFLLHISGVTEI